MLLWPLPRSAQLVLPSARFSRLRLSPSSTIRSTSTLPPSSASSLTPACTVSTLAKAAPKTPPHCPAWSRPIRSRAKGILKGRCRLRSRARDRCAHAPPRQRVPIVVWIEGESKVQGEADDEQQEQTDEDSGDADNGFHGQAAGVLRTPDPWYCGVFERSGRTHWISATLSARVAAGKAQCKQLWPANTIPASRTGGEEPAGRRKGKLVLWARLELARLSPLPPQDSVSPISPPERQGRDDTKNTPRASPAKAAQTRATNPFHQPAEQHSLERKAYMALG